ncbi:outer membrane beta-barrel protein [Agarivorans sp. Alg241-V36]|uniref:outer membrane beta-barrel protein n=1 Tax=Agarivorans sp. Alg241-V36 TaxID=2305992 RepID=UPI0013D5607C|nr:outer membrane beta-barrel protein [Agarivorans sp. Alg241-V36]
MVVFKRLKTCFSFLFFLFASASTYANTYAGGIFSYTSAEYNVDGTSASEGKPWVLQAQVGHFFNDYFALEGRYGVSTGRSGGISIDSLASILAKGNLPITEQTAMYALFGGSTAKLDQQNVASSTESGMSFGLGAHYAFSRNSAVTIEYLSSLNTNKAKVGGVNLAFQYRF